MPLYKTEALILRTYKLGEADRIVVFLTRDRGKKRGVANGARRPEVPVRRGARAAHAGRRRLLRAGTARPGPAQLRRVAVLAAARVAAGRAQPRRVLRRADRRVGAGGRPERAAVPPGDVHARGAGRRRADRRRWPGTSSTGCCACRASIRRTSRVTGAARRSTASRTGACLEPGAPRVHVPRLQRPRPAGPSRVSRCRPGALSFLAAAGRVPPQRLGDGAARRRAWTASWSRFTGR